MGDDENLLAHDRKGRIFAAARKGNEEAMLDEMGYVARDPELGQTKVENCLLNVDRLYKKEEDENGSEVFTPLFVYAAKYAQTNILGCLCSMGGNPNVTDSLGNTALHLAGTMYHPKDFPNYISELIRTLAVDCGVSLKAENYEGEYPIHSAARRGETAAVATFVDDHLREPAIRDAKGNTPLHKAVEAKNPKLRVEVINQMINRYEVDKTTKNNNGETPLMIAAAAGHLEALQKVEVDDMNIMRAQSTGGYTSLHLAAQNGHIETVKYLCGPLKDRKLPRLTSNNGETALQLVCNMNHQLQEIQDYLEHVERRNKVKDLKEELDEIHRDDMGWSFVPSDEGMFCAISREEEGVEKLIADPVYWGENNGQQADFDTAEEKRDHTGLNPIPHLYSKIIKELTERTLRARQNSPLTGGDSLEHNLVTVLYCHGLKMSTIGRLKKKRTRLLYLDLENNPVPCITVHRVNRPNPERHLELPSLQVDRGMRYAKRDDKCVTLSFNETASVGCVGRVLQRQRNQMALWFPSNQISATIGTALHSLSAGVNYFLGNTRDLSSHGWPSSRLYDILWLCVQTGGNQEDLQRVSNALPLGRVEYPTE
eukprot:gb/GECG01008448.1/.p1 GENE.gb/GECG01008448.1/~~gb/GECG01008448.1/.p1  ORF type:complete len:597 (+),score=67.03 gb/GECG01008448.1/:1-1791(+)